MPRWLLWTLTGLAALALAWLVWRGQARVDPGGDLARRPAEQNPGDVAARPPLAPGLAGNGGAGAAGGPNGGPRAGNGGPGPKAPPGAERLLKIGLHQPEGPPGTPGGAGEMRGRVTHLVGDGRPALRTPAAIEAMRREHNQEWETLQKRRNDLRVRMLAEQLRLSPNRQRSLAEAFQTWLDGRLALMKRVSARQLTRQGYREGKVRLEQQTASALREVLGNAGYAVYAKLESERKFGLPEEHKRPPGAGDK